MNSRLYLVQRLVAKARTPLVMGEKVLRETEAVLRATELTLQEIRERRRQRTKLPRPAALLPAAPLGPGCRSPKASTGERRLVPGQ
jgi:hypothetical protein